MHEDDRQTRSHLMELFAEQGIHPRGDLGQNFLIDLNLLEYVATEARLEPHDVVLEVGAGTGALTRRLADQAAAVVAVEIDPNMHRLAARAIGDRTNVRLLLGDALRNKNHLAEAVLTAVREALDAEPGRTLKLVANLPYHVATPIVSNLVASDLPWTRMIVTIQLELAYRMAARAGGENYGALSAWLQSQCRLKVLKRLGPTVFWPRPGVESAIVRIAPAPDRRARIGDREFLHDFLRRLFQQRRKLLRSVLVGMYRADLSKERIDAVLAESGLAPTSRAEQLDVPTLVDLSQRFHAAVGAAAVDPDAPMA